MAAPLERRLQSEYHKVKQLVSESGGSLRLVATEGSPPTKYIIEFKCPSLIQKSDGQIDYRYEHRVEITLGKNYPFERPQAKMITPVFNPHVFTMSNAICLGSVWNASETLDVLILRIGALLQLDPRVLDARSPANAEANDWVRRNKDKIPLGGVTFKAAQPPKSKIKWL